MVIVKSLAWWYSRGWLWQFRTARKALANQAEYYSIGTLLGTLFSPYRQIGTERSGRGLSAHFQAWLDRLVSRIIGALVRLFIIIAGSLVLVVYSLVMGLLFVVWPFVPLLPIVGIILAVMGVGK